MRQIDKLRNEVADQLSLDKELVKDVLNFTDKELLKGFHKGDVVEYTGLGTFFVRNKRRLKMIKETEMHIERLKKYQKEGKEGFYSADFVQDIEMAEQDLEDLKYKFIPHEWDDKTDN